MLWTREHKRCPQGCKAAEETAAGEVTCRQGGHGQAAHLQTLGPIQFASLGYAELAEDRTDSQSGDPDGTARSLQSGQAAYGACAEMVVMIMR